MHYPNTQWHTGSNQRGLQHKCGKHICLHMLLNSANLNKGKRQWFYSYTGHCTWPTICTYKISTCELGGRINHRLQWYSHKGLRALFCDTRPQFRPWQLCGKVVPCRLSWFSKNLLHRAHLVLDIQPLWLIKLQPAALSHTCTSLLSNLLYANRYIPNDLIYNTYNQNLCLMTADQTWIWSYFFAHIHTHIFSAFYSLLWLYSFTSCNRINYFAEFIILFHKKK